MPPQFLSDPTAIASMVSALVAGLGLLLNELRQRKKVDTPADIRAALLQLEGYIAAWADQAVQTNELIRAWALRLPASAGTALSEVLDSMAGQSMYVADVESALGRNVGLIPPGIVPETSGQPTLERVLRVYAPQFFELLVVFSRRKAQLLAMTAKLERLHAAGNRDAIDQYLFELETAAHGLQDARKGLARFISVEFPLSRP